VGGVGAGALVRGGGGGWLVVGGGSRGRFVELELAGGWGGAGGGGGFGGGLGGFLKKKKTTTKQPQKHPTPNKKNNKKKKKKTKHKTNCFFCVGFWLAVLGLGFLGGLGGGLFGGGSWLLIYPFRTGPQLSGGAFSFLPASRF